MDELVLGFARTPAGPITCANSVRGVVRALVWPGGIAVSVDDIIDAAITDSLNRLLSGGAKARKRDRLGAVVVSLSVESLSDEQDEAEEDDEDKVNSSTSRFCSNRFSGIDFGVADIFSVRPRGEDVVVVVVGFVFKANGFVKI